VPTNEPTKRRSQRGASAAEPRGKTAAKKAPADKTTIKKVPVTKVPAKKVPPEKVPAKKAPSEHTPEQKTVPTGGAEAAAKPRKPPAEKAPAKPEGKDMKTQETPYSRSMKYGIQPMLPSESAIFTPGIRSKMSLKSHASIVPAARTAPKVRLASPGASLEIVGVLLSTAQLQGALLGKMQLTGIQANLPNDAGPLVHSIGANTLTQNYLSRLQDNVVYVSIKNLDGSAQLGFWMTSNATASTPTWTWTGSGPRPRIST
jgi:hypothetical protein